MHYLCPFLFCNHLDEKERAGCFVLIAFLQYCACYCSVAVPPGPWIDLQCVIVVFPDHTHLPFSEQLDGGV